MAKCKVGRNNTLESRNHAIQVDNYSLTYCFDHIRLNRNSFSSEMKVVTIFCSCNSLSGCEQVCV